MIYVVKSTTFAAIHSTIQIYAGKNSYVTVSPPKAGLTAHPVVPVLRLSGAIGISSPLSPGLNLSSLAEQIEKAFTVKNAKAVALQINSPGGSPVQSKLIFNRIRALAARK